MSCNDDDTETDRDICTDTVYAKVPSDATDSVEVDFACRGTNAEQKLEEPKVLCDDTVARKDCCIGGEEYRCLNNVLNYTIFAGGDCNNASIATYYWRMDNTCSNVITTEARSRNIYFSGECNVPGRVAQVTSCEEHDYWQWLASETDNFVPFDDSASTLGMFFISVLLLFLYVDRLETVTPYTPTTYHHPTTCSCFFSVRISNNRLAVCSLWLVQKCGKPICRTLTISAENYCVLISHFRNRGILFTFCLLMPK